MPNAIPLDSLAAGDAALVDQLVGQPEQVHRMKEIGLCDGTRIEMVQPGRPCIIRLGGQKLCVRDSELMRVLVRPVTAGPK